ncbi:MAG: hypothetical protein U9Q62_05810 [Campylobacterota bacterium]|nr:hypothetical protein [Campylobacterota bacterium]
MIKRAFLLFLLLSTLLLAKQYDTTIMAIEAKLFPKIALLEQHIKDNKSPTLEITILAIETDYHAAERFKKQIESTYPKGIAERKLRVNISKFRPDHMEKPDAVIVLSHRPEELKAIASWANRNQIVSFSYDPFNLSYGLLISIYFGQSAKPYLNRKVIHENRFVFDHYLLKLSKFYNR